MTPDPNNLRELLERATVQVKKLRAENKALRSAREEPIALIGMACRFPGGANDPAAYWRLLEGGVDAICEIPAERWPADPEAEELPALRWAGLLDGVDGFDAGFYGITPREAVSLDPQQRLLLEVSWEALEDAHQPASQLAGAQVGVFVGLSSLDYQHHVLARDPGELDGYSATGNMASVAAGRISYTLGLQGPCAAVDTACSSSLVAVHLACQSLRNGESELALAGGVNLLLSQTWMVAAGRTQSLSPDGRCRTFDASANGFVRGEGCGMIVLKRLSDALRDGDRIRALVRGSAINHDGRSSGLTVPNVLSQQALLRKALESSRVAPAQVGYVEAHGTGTSIGDPIELEALKAVLGGPREGAAPCAIGSVKTNLGHLEAAAGIAGLIKVVLALEHQAIPRHLHFRALNPRVSLEGTPFVIPAEGLPWKAGGTPRVAGVSSFGISGTNAHVILEEAPAVERGPAVEWDERKGILLPVSARAPEALRALAGSYAERLEINGFEGSLLEVAYTAGVRRSHHPFRLAVAGRTSTELATALRAFSQRSNLESFTGRSSPPKVAMVFPGQGSQWLGMGRELLEQEPAFREAVEAFDAALRKVAGWSALEELRAGPERSRFDQVDVVQPCLVALQLGLAALWRSWGVEPEVVIGQSMGEVSAACVAGALSLEDAARVISTRSSLARRTRGQGAMATVELPADQLAPYLDSRLGIAALNGPSSTLLSGEADAIHQLVSRLSASGVFCRAAKVDYASHSPQMEPLREPLLDALRGVCGRPARLAFRSTVTNTWLNGRELGPDYWYRNLREPVQLFPVVQSLLLEGSIDILLEVSPHPVLAPSLEQAISHCKSSARVVTSLRREQPEHLTLLSSLATLYSLGQDVSFDRLLPTPLRTVSLPSYPWQRQRHWLPASPVRSPRAGDHLPPGRRMRSPALQGALYESRLGPDSLRCFGVHRVEGGAVVPMTWMLSLTLAAVRDCCGEGAVTLREVGFLRPLFLEAGEEREVQLVLSPDAAKPSRFELFAAEAAGPDAAAGWELYAEGTLQSGEAPPAAGPRLDLPALRQRLAPVADTEIAAKVEAPGPERWTGALHLGQGEILCGVRAAQSGDRLDRFRLHPEPIHEALAALLGSLSIEKDAYAIASIGAVRFFASARGPVWIHGTLERRQQAGRTTLSASLGLYDEAGDPLAALSDLTFAPVSLEAQVRRSVGLLRSARYELAWQPLEAPPPPRALEPGSWLVFLDRSGVTEALARLLEAEGHRCVRVERGATDPHSTRYPELIASAGGAGAPPLRGAIYGWAVEAPVDLPEAPFAPGDADICAGALHLVQALAAVPGARLWLPTRGAWAVAERDRSGSPEAAALWGFGRVIASEHPELATRLIDLDPNAAPETSARQLLRAMCGAGAEDQLALRGDRSFGLRLRRVRQAGAAVPLALSPDATYVITGGWGRLGLAVAGWMVQQGARHLLLLGRSQPSEEAARTLRQLEGGGARILQTRADVGNEAALREALDRAERELPPLRGIVHAAGQPHEALIRHQRWEDFERVFASKAAGAWNLHCLTKDRPLDFFVLFSSVAATLGFSGMGSYAAANAYLDALAWYRRQRGLPALSIGWGLWDHGLSGDREKRSSGLGLRAFPLEDGLKALGALLGEAVPQTIVASMDWGLHVAQRTGGGAPPPLLSEVADAPGRAHARRGRREELGQRLSALPSGDRKQLLREYVSGMVAQTLGYPPHHPLDPTRGLFDLGFDSLLAMDLRRRLSADLERPFPATMVFDYPTIEALAAHLLEGVFGTGEQAPPPAPPVRAGALAGATGADLDTAEIAKLSEADVAAQLQDIFDSLSPSPRR